MIPSNISSVIELAKLESAISGILAGFALTIVVLLIERQARNPTEVNYNAKVGSASIIVFTVTFFLGIYASFLFALVGAEVENSARAFLMLLPAAFVSMTTGFLLMLGLALVLRAYHLTEAVRIANGIVFTLVFILSFQFAFSVGLTSAVVYKTPAGEFFSQPQFLIPLYAVPVIGLFTGIVIRWGRSRDKRKRTDLLWFRAFIISCVLFSSRWVYLLH